MSRSKGQVGLRSIELLMPLFTLLVSLTSGQSAAL
jgi:hypothetical protein